MSELQYSRSDPVIKFDRRLAGMFWAIGKVHEALVTVILSDNRTAYYERLEELLRDELDRLSKIDPHDREEIAAGEGFVGWMAATLWQARAFDYEVPEDLRHALKVPQIRRWLNPPSAPKTKD